MLTGRGNPTAYEFVGIRIADQGPPVQHVRIQCAKCQNRLLGKTATTSNRPEAIAKWARAKSWIIEPTTPGSVRCPECQKVAREAARGERPEKGNTTMPTDGAANNVSSLKPPTRPLTANEKMVVRRLLDAQFDETKGVYLEGYSDQRVGQEAAVPWANVRELREAAYGLLRSVPELEALQVEQAQLLARCDELAAEGLKAARDIQEINTKVETLRVTARGLSSRIATIGNRLGVVTA